MLEKILKAFLGDPSQRTLKEIQPYIDQVHAAEQALAGHSDAELRSETDGFRARLRTETQAKTQEREQLKAQAEAEADVDAKEVLYRQIDSLDSDILAEEERILLEILPKPLPCFAKRRAGFRTARSAFRPKIGTATCRGASTP